MMYRSIIAVLLAGCLLSACAKQTSVDSQASSLITEVSVVKRDDIITVFLPTDGFFLDDSAEIDKDRYPELDAAINFIIKHPDTKVLLADFTKVEVNNADENALHEPRAQAVFAFMQANGVAAKRLINESYAQDPMRRLQTRQPVKPINQKNYTHPLKADLLNIGVGVVKYGDTITVFLPTDAFFAPNSAKLNKLRYPDLAKVMDFIRQHPQTNITIAGFTDDVGTKAHKNILSEQRAKAMLAFIWANGVDSKRLVSEGYGDRHSIADNAKVAGSYLNRRLEIQLTPLAPIERQRIPTFS